MALKNAIILETPTDDAPGRDQEVRVAYWLDIPAARQKFYVRLPTYVSQFIDASAAELTALRNGSVVEVVETMFFAGNTTDAQRRTAILARRAELQTYYTNFNPWRRYGSYHNGSGWTGVTVA